MKKNNSTKNIVLISWTRYSRHTDLLGKSLNAQIFFIDNIISSRSTIWKLFFWIDYSVKSFLTLKIILKTKPKIVFMQNPPSIAPIILSLINIFIRFRIVFDSHNGAFESPWVRFPGHKWALKNADLVIIHNQQLYNNLVNYSYFQGINFRVLNSRLSEFADVLKEPQTQPYFLVVTTFSEDEPMEELLEGIKNFYSSDRKQIKFKITGNYKRKPDLVKKYSAIENIDFLGFVSEDRYKYLLVNTFCMISLSTRNDVQQFSLMEAVGSGVPFISSNNETNRALFNNKMILAENNADAIEKSIVQFISDREIYLKNIVILKNEQKIKWENDFNNILSQLKF